MKSARFFVTAVLIFGTLSTVVACKGGRNRKQEMVKQGDAKITEMSAVESDLEKQSIYFTPRAMNGRLMSPVEMAKTQNWRRFSKAERGSIKASLAHYLKLSNEVLEIDAQPGVYVDRKDQFNALKNSAEKFQKSLEDFETTFGENFEPKLDGAPQDVLVKLQSI